MKLSDLPVRRVHLGIGPGSDYPQQRAGGRRTDPKTLAAVRKLIDRGVKTTDICQWLRVSTATVARQRAKRDSV